MTHSAGSHIHRFMLRRTLVPWKFQETIDEAVDYCRAHGVDEVIWKIDAEEFSHGLPTHERIRAYLPWLRESRERLNDAGVSMSINPWVTQGMRDAGWDLREVFPAFDWMTDITGVQAKSQACPLSPAWRQWLYGAYDMYASCNPRVVWIEDDIRIIRHRPVYYSCYCPRHLDEFARRTGHRFTREDLAKEILHPGTPSPVRGKWLDFLGAVIVETLEGLAQRVRQTNPQVRIGLMCSAPPMHAAETRDWDRILAAVAGSDGIVTIRPAMGNYQETTPRGVYETRQLVGSTLACVRRPVQACGEVENWPFTRFSKSVRFTRAQVLLAMAMRCSTLTFNAYDHVGTPLDAEPGYGRMLRDVRPQVEALAAVYRPDGVERGVGILHHEKGPQHKRVKPCATFADLFMGPEPWAERLEAMGLPVTWGASDVVAVTGPKLQAYADRLDEIFAKGVLLDLSALETVIGMGRVDLVGVDLAGTFLRKERETAAEQLTDPAFGQAGTDYMTLDMLGLEQRIGVLTPRDGARVVSQIVNPDRERLLPALTLVENPLGGRVAIYPYDFEESIPLWFLNWHRRRQLHATIDWLCRGHTPLTVGAVPWPLPIRTDYSGYTLVSIMNLSLDPWDALTLTLPATGKNPGAVHLLHGTGEWTAVPASSVTQHDGRLVLSVDAEVEPLDLCTVKIDW